MVTTIFELGSGIDFTIDSLLTPNTNNTTLPPPQQNNTLQVALSYTLTAVMAVGMIGIGCAVDYQKTKAHILKPTGVIIGFFCQFVFMPVIAFVLSKIFVLNSYQALALLIVGSCPGGTGSNLAAYYAGADMDLSVTMTTLSTALGLGVMPLLLYIYSTGFSENELQVPFQTIGIALACLIVPIILGMIIRVKKPKLAEKLLKILSSVGVLAVLATVVASLVSYGPAVTISSAQIGCAAFFPGVGMGLGYGLASLLSLHPRLFMTHRQRRTICIETGIQNTQLAGAVIQLSFGFKAVVQMILFPVAYFISQLVWVIILVTSYRIYLWKYAPENVIEVWNPESSGSEKKDEKNVAEADNNAFEMAPPAYKDAMKMKEVTAM